MIGFGHIAEPDFYTHFPAMLPRSSRPRAAWGTGVYPSKQYFDIKMRCLRQRRHRRRWYLKGADNTPYEKIDGEVRSLAGEVPFEIPDSWEWVRIRSLGEIVRGSGIKRNETVQQGLPCVRYGELYTTYQTSFTSAVSFIAPDLYEKCKHFSYGDVLMTLTGENKPDIAKAVAYLGTEPIAASGDLAFWTRHGMNPLFLSYIMASPYIIARKVALATGDIIVHISGDKLGTILLPVPPLAEQERIVACIQKAELVIENYAIKATALQKLQDSFSEALKKSILQEAVQGKLVPQDPSDEPAEALLERIRAEKQRLIKEGKIKKDKHESVIFRRDNSHYEKLDGVERCIDDELPFEIPDSWVWVRLGTVLEIARGGSPRPIQQYLTTEPDGINWIKIGDTDKGGKYIYKTKEKIRPEGVTKSRMVHSGDFLLTNSMSFGRPYILKTDGCIHDGWLVLSNRFDCYSVDFIYYILSSPFAYYQFCDSVSGAVVKNLNSDKVANALFPLPPLAEQHRIVQRIEELLPLVKGL